MWVAVFLWMSLLPHSLDSWNPNHFDKMSSPLPWNEENKILPRAVNLFFPSIPTSWIAALLLCPCWQCAHVHPEKMEMEMKIKIKTSTVPLQWQNKSARVLSLQPDGAARTWGSTRATEASWVPVESLCDWRVLHQSECWIRVFDVSKPITRGETGTERLTKINRNWCAWNCRHYGSCRPCKEIENK